MHSDEVNQKIMLAELKEAKGSIDLEESASKNRNRMIGTPINPARKGQCGGQVVVR